MEAKDRELCFPWWYGPSDHSLSFWTPLKPVIVNHLRLMPLDRSFQRIIADLHIQGYFVSN